MRRILIAALDAFSAVRFSDIFGGYEKGLVAKEC
jgi:hypothetical protein